MPEALKNLLLVMASRGILTEQWRVRILCTQMVLTLPTVRVTFSSSCSGASTEAAGRLLLNTSLHSVGAPGNFASGEARHGE